MGGVYKRKTDKARGKAGKYTCYFIGPDGRRRTRVGVTDRAKSLEMANHYEAEARKVRDGLVDPGASARKVASARPIAEHVESYRLGLLAKGDTAKHARHVHGVLARLLTSAAIGTAADLSPERIQSALARLAASGRSPRTCNHALGAVKAFAAWLADNNRIGEFPRGLRRLKPGNEDVDRRRVRRAATPAELARLLAASPADRAALYRVAMGTGFRARELRALRPGWFALDGEEPAIILPAEHTKNGKPARQPIARHLAVALAPYIASRDPACPALVVPARTAEMLRADLAAAGIPHETEEGVLDFHAIRTSFISNLIAAGVDPKTVQVLARHSTITLTIDRYSKTSDERKRKALEGEK